MDFVDAFGITDKPELLGNLMFLLPALSFGLLWYSEKNTNFYAITAISVIIGIFCIVFSLLERMKTKANPASYEEDLKYYKEMADHPKSPENLGRYQKKIIAAILIWFVLFLWAIVETVGRLVQPVFALLFLLQIGFITYLVSIFLLRQTLIVAGRQAVQRLKQKK